MIKRIATAMRRRNHRTPEERKIRRRRILLRNCDDFASESISDKDRLLVWTRSIIDPTRFADSFEWLPKSLRPIFQVVFSVILSLLLLIPVLVLSVFLWIEIAVHFVMGFIYNPERPKLTRPSELVKNINAGAKLSEGGKKGAAAKAKLELNAIRDEELQNEARRLLESGKEISQVAGILERRYSGVSGYPTTVRRYRDIIKPLRSELNGN